MHKKAATPIQVFKKEVTEAVDALEDLAKAARAKAIRQDAAMRRSRMRYTKAWAGTYGKGKPRWKPVLKSSRYEPLALADSYYTILGFATKTTHKVDRRTGKRWYYLQLYDSVARSLREKPRAKPARWR